MSDGGAPGGPARSPGFCSRPLTPDGAVAVGGCGEAAAPLPVSGRTWRELQAWGPAAGERLRARQLGGSCPGGHAAVRPDLGATWRLRSPGPAVPAPAPGEWVRAVGVRGGAGAGELGLWEPSAFGPGCLRVCPCRCTLACFCAHGRLAWPAGGRGGRQAPWGAHVGDRREPAVQCKCRLNTLPWTPFLRWEWDAGRSPDSPQGRGPPACWCWGRAALLVQETPRAPLAPAAVPLSLVIRHLLHFFPWKLVRF